jgi:hypothetical protein
MSTNRDVGPNPSLSIIDSDNANPGDSNNDDPGNAGTISFNDKPDNSSQPLPPSPYQNSGGDETIGEELASNATIIERGVSGTKWNNSNQARHWCLTKNNYTFDDETQWKEALVEGHAKGEVVTAIVAKEVGESGTPHFQAYIHFKKLKRQSAIHGFFGYDSPCIHLSVQGKEGRLTGKPPLAAFRYCMKGGDYYVIGKNLDEIDRLKTKTIAGTGRCSSGYIQLTEAIEKGEVKSMADVRKMNPELAAKHEEYWKSLLVQHMPKRPFENHPLRPWQEMLVKKLEEPFSDREVIFVIDKKGNAGKSWLTRRYTETELHGKRCYKVGADKRDDISYQLINNVIEYGPPDAIFMDVPRARSAYVSSPFLEEIKNGNIVSTKYKSKTLSLPRVPHMTVMMNEFPVKNPNELGLSDDRYVYLFIDNNGLNAQWFTGYRQDEGGPMAPGFNPPQLN